MVTRIDIQKRTASLDIARLVALFCVISVHFFLFNGFYEEPCSGWKMFLFCCMRCAFMACIPLFLLLTGYLQCGKKVSARYFRGVDKVLGIYVLCSLICYLAKKYYFDLPETSLFDILDYTASTYAWYVDMYLGLFLLAPFLNLIYWGLNGKKQKRVLILVLICLAQLPSMLNIFDWKTPGALLDPSLIVRAYMLVPSFWSLLYPLTYYFIGAYLREYRVQMKKLPNLLAYLAALLAYSGFAFFMSGGGIFVSGVWQNWGSLLLLPCGVLLFLFLSNLNTARLGRVPREALAMGSEVTFGAYLLSCIFDKIFYDWLNEKGLVFFDRMKYFPGVLVTFLLSLMASYSVTVIYSLLREGGDAAVNRLRRKKAREAVTAER